MTVWVLAHSALIWLHVCVSQGLNVNANATPLGEKRKPLEEAEGESSAKRMKTEPGLEVHVLLAVLQTLAPALYQVLCSCHRARDSALSLLLCSCRETQQQIDIPEYVFCFSMTPPFSSTSAPRLSTVMLFQVPLLQGDKEGGTGAGAQDAQESSLSQAPPPPQRRGCGRLRRPLGSALMLSLAVWGSAPAPPPPPANPLAGSELLCVQFV